MAITPLDAVGKQLENAARNQVRGAQAQVQRETSIVRQANARLGAALNQMGKPKESRETRRKHKSGVYVKERIAFVALDGYVRRSPVQELRVDPGYGRKMLKRALGAVITVLALLGIALLLIKYFF